MGLTVSIEMDQLQEITSQLLKFSPDALIVVDHHGAISFANEAVHDVLGYMPQQLLGQSVEMLIPDRLRSSHASYMMGYMRQPRKRDMAARAADLVALRADGTEFPASIRLSPFQVGADMFVAAAIRDISEQRKINKELLSAKEEALRANRAKSRFLATASHDLRQPLQAIRLINASLVKMAELDHEPNVVDQCGQLLSSQAQAIEGMARMLNSLLEISRLESGAIELKLEPVTLREIFDEIKYEFEAIASARGIHLRIPQTNIVLNTDRTLFHQILQNLVGNAIKYTNQGHVEVFCDAEKSEMLFITVGDTGIGIPEDKLERIFDEYYQIDAHSGNRSGVGLGLAIVREAIRLLGYKIKVLSRVGDGTQACVGIPKNMLMAAHKYVQVEEPRPVVVAHKPRVVLIEDNDSVRVSTELFLKLEGYEVVTAASVAETDKLVQRLENNDVIISDYHLDGAVTGLDVLNNIRTQLAYDVPAIIMSGDLPAVLRTLKNAVPNCRFLGKPVDTDSLLSAINELGATPPLTTKKARTLN